MNKLLIYIPVIFIIIISANQITSAAPADHKAGWYMLSGINGGTTFENIFNDFQYGSYLVGGEISFAYFNGTNYWWGSYCDSIWVFEPKVYRFSLGAEFGMYFGGFEVGYLLEHRNSEVNHGVRVGLIGSIHYVSLYCRYGHLFTTDENEHILEIGALVKLSFLVAED